MPLSLWDTLKEFVEHVSAIRKSAHAMRKVGTPHKEVDSDVMAQLHGHAIVDEPEAHVVPNVLAARRRSSRTSSPPSRRASGALPGEARRRAQRAAVRPHAPGARALARRAQAPALDRARGDRRRLPRASASPSTTGPRSSSRRTTSRKLGFPPDHPATDMQDSFWTTNGLVLRTHTSNIQIRAMSTKKPPLAFVAPGAIYRRDDDATHSPMFSQIEASWSTATSRWRTSAASSPSSPSASSARAARCAGARATSRSSSPAPRSTSAAPFCRQPDGTRKGCSVCKHTGWVEILGCGMIHPVVFEACGIDPEEWTGFALGMGIERMAMVRYDLPDLRLFFDNDPRFLAQF